jgi:protein phosphatase
LCTDGLSGLVSDDEIDGVLGMSVSLSIKAQQLFRRANAVGGTDNVSVVLITPA